MIVLYFIIIGFAIGYVFLILHIYEGWQQTNDVTIDEHSAISTSVTIVVPARNESSHIVACIESILACTFSTIDYEILVINDHSTDDTLYKLQQCNHPRLIVIDLPEGIEGKKNAISYAMKRAKGKYILTTDADSEVGRWWVMSSIANMLEAPADIATSLVVPRVGETVLSRFQFLDFVATMCITANGYYEQKYFLANGANMCYTKELFEVVGGYEGNESIASGDDLFLLAKAAKQPHFRLSFLKSKAAIVWTKSEDSWSSLVEQRKRWATKSMKVADTTVIKIQSYVFVFSLVIVFSLLIGLFVSGPIFFAGLTALALKWTMDYLFLSRLCAYYQQESVMKSFFTVSMLYFVHIIYSGCMALFPSDYIWKGVARK